MSVLYKFIIFQSIIVSGFTIGYIGRNFFQDRIKKMILFNLICLEPLVILNSTWGIDLSFQLIFLPFTGFAIVLLGFLAGRIIAPLIFNDRIKQTTFTISSSLSNQGFTMGAFICYMLIGFEGLSLSIIFILYFTFYAFGFIFSYASIVRYDHAVTVRFLFSHIFQLRNMPLLASCTGLVCTGIGISRPVPILNFDAVIYIAVFIYFISLGTQFEFKNAFRLWKPSLLLALIKFIIIPCSVFTVFFFFHFDLQKNVKLVIFLQSFMPVAVFSVVAASLYDLDTKMSSALFMTNTILFLVVVLPLLVVSFSFIEPLL